MGPTVNRTYRTRQKEAEILKKLSIEFKKNSNKEEESDGGSAELGLYDYGFSENDVLGHEKEKEVEVSEDDHEDEEEVGFVREVQVGSTSGVKDKVQKGKIFKCIDLAEEDEDEDTDDESVESESEEEDDDEEDEDYVIEKSGSFASLDEKNYSEEEVSEHEDEDVCESVSKEGRKGEKRRGNFEKKNKANRMDESESGEDTESENHDVSESVGRMGKKGEKRSRNFEKEVDRMVIDLVESSSSEDDSKNVVKKGGEKGKERGRNLKRKRERLSKNLDESDHSGVKERAEEDVSDNLLKKRGKKSKDRQEREPSLKRKRLGLEIPVDTNKNEIEAEGVGTSTIPKKDCVAKRTRSQFVNKLKRKKVQLGTITQPYCIDVGDEEEEENDEELDDSCGDDSNVGGLRMKKKKKKSNRKDDGHIKHKQSEKSRKSGKSAKRKKNRFTKNFDVLKVLAASLFDKEGASLEESGSSRDFTDDEDTNLPANQPSHPQILRFGVKDSKPPEKSDFEKELDQLWVEFDFVRGCADIGSACSYKVDKYDHCPKEAKANVATLCRQGNHCFVLDEEIGVICRYCSFVKLDIKNILPAFSPQPWGSERKKDDKADPVTFDELQFEDVGHDSQLGCDSCLPAKGTVWDLIPKGTWKGMFPHQREGFEFIWKNIAGGIVIDEVKKHISFNKGSGCIISHAPGTGKSRLTIVFLEAYKKLYPKCRLVIIAPKIMLDSWKNELKKWKVEIPFHDLSMDKLIGEESEAAINYLKGVKPLKRNVNYIRLVKLFSWRKDGGILGINYNLFESLAGGGKMAGEVKRKDEENAEFNEQIGKALLLLPDLVVLDEGHTPRNDQSSIWKALSKIKTEKRIILSGTPFQNNFDELFNTLCLVRPKFTKEFRSDHHNHQKPARRHSTERRKWHDLIGCIGRDGDTNSINGKLKELKVMLDPFVHIHKGDILRERLPRLRDFVVILKPGHLQKSLLDRIGVVKDNFTSNRLLSSISVHPSLLSDAEKDHFCCDRDEMERLKLNPNAGVKTKFLMELVKLSQTMNEKVLVFSEFLAPLTLVMEQLKSYFGWTEGREVVYMDGQSDVKQRQSSIKAFNNLSGEANVLLASIKACGEGINLVGASRVVLLDVVWNPSVERQAISRAYRLGQERAVFVYHLISGKMEYDKFSRQTKKDWFSKAVFSSADRDSNGHKAYDISDDKILEELVQHEKIKDIFEYIRPKDNLFENFGLVDEDFATSC